MSLLVALGFVVFVTARSLGEPDPNWVWHDRDRPQPEVVDPGTLSSQDEPGNPPSDAIILFDGKDLSQWVAMNGSPTRWMAKNGVMECVPGSGYIRTLQSFGDCQLHVEWASPNPPHGDGQARGNSGVFFGYDRYECQVLDSYRNRTYADGSAAAIYGQYPPLVNVMLPPGKWETYDIVWTAPRFDPEGNLTSKARETVFHNGVLVQNNVELTGRTDGFGRVPYRAHPERLPIALQDHGNPVRFRNIWVRELGNYHHKEFMLPDTLLDSYTGDYGEDANHPMRARRAADGLLTVNFGGGDVLVHAMSMTRFYSLTMDFQCQFDFTDSGKEIEISTGDDQGNKLRRLTP
jgi:hypothetical protein